MKYIFRSVVLLLCAGILHAAPTITISPTTITNNFVGSIQIAISNLSAPGAQVHVDRFLDVNSNGIVQLYYWPGQSFYVTDGEESTIGGVRNSNVPGDDDGATNGSILTHVPYPGVDLTLSHTSGQYIYRVKDLGNNETATAIMEVQQQVLPQGVRGQVFTSTGVPLSNATVAISQQNGNNGFGAVTDTNGQFTLYGPPGQYDILMVYTEEIANAALLTINSNSFTTFNLTNTPSDGTFISGSVKDSVSGVGLPGILMLAQTADNQFVYKATDDAGDYLFEVDSNQWTVQLGGYGAILGYAAGPTNQIAVNTLSGSVSNVAFQLIKGNALVYGTVTTPPSTPVASIEMDASDTNNSLFEGRGITDSNGFYSIAIVAGGDDVQLDGNLTGYINPGGVNFTVSNGQAIEENFVLQPISATISGRAEDNLGNPLSNLNLIADPTNDPSGSQNISFESAANGAFSVGVGPGTWNLFVECNTANADNLISPYLTVTVTNNQNLGGQLLVAQRATATIYGRVTDSSGTPLPGINMFGNASSDGKYYVSGCVNTDTNGNYSILVFPAEWSVGGNYPGMTNENAVVTGTTSVVLNFVIPSSSGQPSLSRPIVSGGQVQFEVNGNNGQGYAIEASTNLASGWKPIYTNYGSFSFTNALGANRAQFFRAVAVP